MTRDLVLTGGQIPRYARDDRGTGIAFLLLMGALAVPAAEAGIRPGDEILSFGGRPVAELRLTTLREMLRQPGKQYRVQLNRGGATLAVELRTRRLV